jgi:m7GpppX diphosphatase
VHGDELRIYFHYHPSYYHLHVHFTHLKYSAPKTLIGQAHLLDDVIDNIKNIAPDYYQKKTISFCVKESSALWQAFDKNTHTDDDIS